MAMGRKVAFALTVAASLATAAPTMACRVPWRFVPANETHDVVVVATAVSRTDWGRYSYDTGFPIVRETGAPLNRLHAREWTAVLRTSRVLRGEAPEVIQVMPDTPDASEDILISSCWDGISTPQPGKTYAVYLDRRNGALRTTRLVDIDFSLRNDPLFSSTPAVAVPD